MKTHILVVVAGLILGLVYAMGDVFGVASDAAVTKGLTVVAATFALAAYLRIGDD